MPSGSSHAYAEVDSARTSLDHDYEKSDEQRERSRSEADIQHAADTMIAVTESYRHHYREQNSDDFGPRPPQPTYTHSRSSSSSSNSFQQLLERQPTRQPSLSSLGTLPSIPSPDPQYSRASIPDILVPGLPASIESQSLLQSERDDLESTSTAGPEDLIRLASPNLPPRLDTPHTPPPRDSHPAALTPGYSNPYLLPMDQHHPVPETQVDRGGLIQAARRFDAFKPPGYQYTALRPDLGTDRQPLGNTTRVRSGSDLQPLVSKELIRKPVAPGARTVEFNHESFTNEILFVSVICLAQVLSLAGLAQALVPAPAIGGSFSETTAAHLAWYTSAYALTSGLFVLLGTRLGSVFGQKRTFVVGYVWFGLWSLLAGLSIYVRDHGSAGTPYFCFCRAMQGIGPALLIPNGQAMLRRAYPPGQRKTLAIGLFDVSAPVGFVLGAVMSSLFANFMDWPWAFYSLATVCLALAALSTLIIPGRHIMMHDLDGSLWERLDVPALLCGTTGLVLFSVGWNQAPVDSFNKAYTYVLIIIGVLFALPFLFLETKARHPLIPLRQMRAPTGMILGCTAAGWAAFGIWLWYLVQFLEGLRGWKPLRLSAGFVPLIASGGVAAVLNCNFLSQKSRAPGTMFASTLAILAGSILMATAPVKQSYWLNTFFSILVVPLGMVLLTPTTIMLFEDSLPEGHQGLASGLAVTAMGYAISVGLGMAGAVESHVRDRKEDVVDGYRAAQYLGVGFSGLSVLMALGFLAVKCLRR